MIDRYDYHIECNNFNGEDVVKFRKDTAGIVCFWEDVEKLQKENEELKNQNSKLVAKVASMTFIVSKIQKSQLGELPDNFKEEK